MIFKIILFILVSFISSSCSEVKDPASQDSIYISDYCPEMKYCGEGKHVMCMYYDESSPLGPLCENYEQTTITQEMIDMFLEIINDARSRVATGVERGMDNAPLPRGYGIMRLKWDKELATFAQILANQCFLGKGDECRATNRFSNPSQAISMVNFFHPDWGYTGNTNDSDVGLTERKIIYGLGRAISSWVPEKKNVTKEMILNYPGPEVLTTVDRYFLNAVRGGSTHMGCGISAFTKYNTAANANQDIFNMLEFICNFADSPQLAQPVYMTDPPIPGTGFSEQCGCPRGYKESEGCLCIEDTDYVKPTTSTEAAYYVPRNRNQKIRGPPDLEQFTEKTLPVHADDHAHIFNYQKDKDMKIFKAHETQDPVQTRFIKKKTPVKKQYAFLPIFKIETITNEPLERTYSNILPPILRYDNLTIVPRNEAVKYNDHLRFEERYERITPRTINKNPKNQYYYNNKDLDKFEDTEVSVIRRSRLGRESKLEQSTEYSFEATRKRNDFKDDFETDVNTEEDSDQYQFPHQRNEYSNDNVKLNLTRRVRDDNLMNLLDILERKVSNIEMDYKEREIFDVKMRKIYKTVLNKQKEMQQAKHLPQLKQKRYGRKEDIENEFRELKNFLKLKSQHSFDNDRFHSTRRFSDAGNTGKQENKLIKFGRENNVHDQHKEKLETPRKEIIDDKLLDILIHKYNQMTSEGDYKFVSDINGRQTYMDRQLRDINAHKSETTMPDDLEIDYDDVRDYANLPIPRNQETFYKSDRRSYSDEPGADDRKLTKFTHLSDHSDGEYGTKVSHIPKLGKDHIIGDRRVHNRHKLNKKTKGTGRIRFSFFDEPEEDTRSFRRMENYNLHRPHRRVQLNQINTPWKSRIHQITNPYYLSDRATY